MTNTIENKQCSKCKEAKALTEFSKHSVAKDGLQRYCKSCDDTRKKDFGSTLEGRSQQAVRNARRVAKQYGVESTLTLPEVRSILSCEKCVYCNKSLELSEKSIDHVHPMQDGGANTFDNAVLACLSCNKAKNSKPPYDFVMQKANSDATRHLLATLATRFDESPHQALRRLEAQHSAHIEKQFRAKHYGEAQ